MSSVCLIMRELWTSLNPTAVTSDHNQEVMFFYSLQITLTTERLQNKAQKKEFSCYFLLYSGVGPENHPVIVGKYPVCHNNSCKVSWRLINVLPCVGLQWSFACAGLCLSFSYGWYSLLSSDSAVWVILTCAKYKRLHRNGISAPSAWTLLQSDLKLKELMSLFF